MHNATKRGVLGVLTAAALAAISLSHARNPAEVKFQALAREPEILLLRAGIGDPAATPPPLDKSALKTTPAGSGGREYAVVQFEGPLGQDVYDQWCAQGVEFLSYIPNNGYIVRKPPTAKRLASTKTLRWIDALRAGYKTEPELLNDAKDKSAAPLEALVVVWPGESRDELIATMKLLGARIISTPDSQYDQILRAQIPAGLITDIAALPQVEWIERAPRITMRNNQVSWAIQSASYGIRPIWDHGIHGDGQIVGHIDDPLDMTSCFFRDDSGTPVGPMHRKVVAIRGDGDPYLHGNHTAGTIAGFRGNGDTNYAGMAYAARLSHSSTGLLPEIGNDMPQNETGLAALFEAAQEDGAFIHSNSWGEDSRRNYTFFCVANDTFAWDNEDSLIVFAATNRLTVYTPENSKNVLAVGATKRPPDIDSRFTGGIGPTRDGRRKPEIFAPGESTISAGLGDCNPAALSGTSMACAAVAGGAALVRQYFVDGWYPKGEPRPENSFTPSGALLKAVLLNSTRDMTNVPDEANAAYYAPYPNELEGWGHLVLDDALYFNNDPRELFVADERRSQGRGLTTGASRSYELLVGGNDQDLRLTLAWMDPPVAYNTEQAAVNNLNLTVRDPYGRVYTGNVFQDGYSVPGGQADAINNVEQILIHQATEGIYTATVTAPFVDITHGPQGYAFVATGALSTTKLVFDKPAFRTGTYAELTLTVDNLNSSYASIAIYSTGGDEEHVGLSKQEDGLYRGKIFLLNGSAYPGDGLISTRDGDVLTAEFTNPSGGFSDLTTARVDNTDPRVVSITTSRNQDRGMTLRLTASESVSGKILGGMNPGDTGLESPLVSTGGDDHVYTAGFDGLIPGVGYYFSVEMSDDAGNEVSENNRGEYYLFVAAEPQRILSANFEGSNHYFTNHTTIGTAQWTRIESPLARSGEELMFVQNPEEQQDVQLTSPKIDLPDSGPCYLEFWHTYAFDTKGYDGGVLEIYPTESNQWIDLDDAIEEGRYDGVIVRSPPLDNPLGLDRRAWLEGTLAAPQRVRVNLQDYLGQTVFFRWHLGASSYEAGIGWYIDDVSIVQYTVSAPKTYPPGPGWMMY